MSSSLTCPTCSRPLTAPGGDGRCRHCAATEDGSEATGSFGTDGWQTVDQAASTSARPQELPERIGRFVPLQLLGEGTFGRVYRARDPQLEREVALKVAKEAQLSTPERIERFFREARASAQLRHPHIVPLFETGRDGATYYIASAYIPGRTLEAACAAGRFEQAAAARLGRKLAEALAYAHATGLVHRDVKPANVMIDDTGEPHLLDFGLATRHQEGQERLTHAGAVLGTPLYMAPEQAEGRTQEVGPASDQYSLGVVLYELLTGQPPYTGPMHVVLAAHSNAPVPRPQGLPRDLETIVLKTLDKDPRKRYANCQELADDLRRWLEGEPIRARRLALLERVGRWVVRNRVVAALTATVLLALAVGGAVAGYFAYEATQAATKEKMANAELAKALAGLQRETRGKEEATAARERGYRAALYARDVGTARTLFERHDLRGTQAALRALPVDLRGWEWDYLDQRCQRRFATLLHARHPIAALAVSPDGKWIAVAGGVPRAGEVRLVDAATRASEELGPPADPVLCLAFSPDGRWLAGGTGRTVHLWEVATRQLAATLAGPLEAVSDVAFTAGGKRVVAGSLDGTVRLWEVTSGEEVQRIDFPPAARVRIACQPSGKLLALTSSSGLLDNAQIDLWDLEANQRLARFPTTQGAISRLRFNPDGDYLLASDDRRAIRLWDISTYRAVRLLREVGPMTSLQVAFSTPVQDVAITKDDRLIAAVEVNATGGGGRLVIWDQRTQETTATLNLDRVGTALAFAPDQRHLYLAAGRTLHRWEVKPSLPEALPHGGTSAVEALALRPDGRQLVVGDRGSATLLDLPGGKVRHRLGGIDQEVLTAAYSPDGSEVLTGTGESELAATTPERGGRILRWDATTGQLLGEYPDVSQLVRTLAYHPDGTLVAVGSGSTKTGSVTLRDPARGTVVRTLASGRAIVAVAFSPDGRRVAALGQDGRAQVWDTDSGAQLTAIDAGRSTSRGCAFSPDSKHLLLAAKQLCLWDIPAGTPHQVFEGHTMPVRAVAFHPDGSRLFSTAAATFTHPFEQPRLPELKVWECQTGTELLALAGHQKAILALAVSPDGHRLYSAGEAEGVWIWDASVVGDRCLRGHSESLTVGTLAANPALLATGAGSGTVLLWDWRTQTALGGLPPDGEGLSALALNPAGDRLARGARGNLRVLNPRTGEVLGRANDHLGAVTALRYLPDGKQFVAAWGKQAFTAAQEPDALGLHDGTTGSLVREFTGNPGRVECVAVSSDGTLVAAGIRRLKAEEPIFGNRPSAPNPGVLCVWDTATGAIRFSRGELADAPSALAFTPDGRELFAATSAGAIRVWDLVRAAPVRDLDPDLTDLSRLLLAPGGERLLVAGHRVGRTETVHWLDARSGQVLRSFSEPDPVPTLLDITPDGRWILAGGADQRIHLYPVPERLPDARER